MNAHVDGRQNGAALKPLSALQIRVLITLAREAFLSLCDRGALGDSAEFDAWRHQQCMQVAECGGLRQCRNEDFLPLKAHFLRLAGAETAAQAALERAAIEPRTWAMNGLQQACTRAADVLPCAIEYAAGFIRNKRGCTLDEADETTLRHAAYLVSRKADQLRRQRRVA